MTNPQSAIRNPQSSAPPLDDLTVWGDAGGSRRCGGCAWWVPIDASPGHGWCIANDCGRDGRDYPVRHASRIACESLYQSAAAVYERHAGSEAL